MRSLLPAVAVIAVAFCTGANAQTDAIQHPYQVVATTSCAYAGACLLVFPPTTAKTIVLRSSCVFTLPNGGTVLGGSLSVNSDANPTEIFQTFPYPPIAGNSEAEYFTNVESHIVADKGQTFSVTIQSYNENVDFLQCSLFGTEL